MTQSAFLFPGQGAQVVGMGRATAERVPAARQLFERAAGILGYDLLQLCLEGPAEKLNATAVSQPALFVAGLAAVETLRHDQPQAIDACRFAAGLSLGEYTALVFAGALDFDDGLRVVQVRGESMQQASDATPSGMVSVLGLEAGKVEELCAAAAAEGCIRIANYLCPGNLVVSGAAPACAAVERLASELGAMKTVRLAVAGAFHTEIMQPAQTRLAETLAAITIRPPRIAVVSNVDAQPHADPDEIRALLVRQVVEPVLWERSMQLLLAQGVERFYELGPGRVLAGLLKRIHRKADVVNVSG